MTERISSPPPEFARHFSGPFVSLMSETLSSMHLADETSDKIPATAPIGWCDTRDSHDGRFDHRQQPGCRNFIPDTEHTDRMLSEARLSEQHVHVLYPCGATNPEAAYIADYRPY